MQKHFQCCFHISAGSPVPRGIVSTGSKRPLSIHCVLDGEGTFTSAEEGIRLKGRAF